MVDDIFVQAMKAENKRLDYLRQDFRTSPTAYNPNEMSVAKLFKQKQEKELKMNIKLKLLQKSDPNKKIEGLTPQQIQELIKKFEKEEQHAPKVISMRQYLEDFCKMHGIEIDRTQLTKLPMHIYLNSAENGAFSEYKKGKIFDMLDENKRKKMMEDAEVLKQQEIKNRLMGEHGMNSAERKQYKTKWHERYETKSKFKNLSARKSRKRGSPAYLRLTANSNSKFKDLSKTTLNSPNRDFKDANIFLSPK